MKNFHRKIFAVFLIILIANQEFCSAKAAVASKKRLAQEDFNQIVHDHARRHKRLVGAVLIGVALFASVANIGFDVYLQVKGCCGLYPDACTYQSKFDDVLSKLETTSSNIDAKWLASTNLLTYISTVSIRNEEIALQMKRITEVYTSIILGVDSEALNKYNNISAQLKAEIAAKNKTVLTYSYADLNTRFISAFSTSLGTLKTLSGLIGQIASITFGYVWNWYKTAQIQTFLRTTYGQQLTNAQNNKFLKVIGAGDDMNAFVKETATARRSADISVSRGSKALEAASSIMALVQIGVEIWMAILKVQQCQTVRNNIRDAYFQIQPEYENMTALYNAVTDNYNNMSSTWNFLQAQLKSTDFLGYLSQIKNLTDSASTETASLKSASANIQLFMDTILSTTDMKQTSDLQNSLILALQNVTFTMSCLQKKVQTFQAVSSRCASGQDTLSNLFNAAVIDFGTNSNDCTTSAGVAYTQYSSVQTYVQNQATANKFDPDCPMNNQITATLVCDKKCSGLTDTQIANVTGLSAEYVTKFKAKCPSSCPVSPADKIQICYWKSLGLSLQMAIQLNTGKYDAAAVTAAYNACP